MVYQLSCQSRRNAKVLATNRITTDKKASSSGPPDDVAHRIITGDTFGYGLPNLFDIIQTGAALMPENTDIKHWVCGSLRRISGPDILHYIEEQDMELAKDILLEISNGSVSSSRTLKQGIYTGKRVSSSSRGNVFNDERSRSAILEAVAKAAKAKELESQSEGVSSPGPGPPGNRPAGGSTSGVSGPASNTNQYMNAKSGDSSSSADTGTGFAMPGSNAMIKGASEPEASSTSGGFSMPGFNNAGSSSTSTADNMPSGFFMVSGRKKRGTSVDNSVSEGKFPPDDGEKKTEKEEGDNDREYNKLSDTYKDLIQKRLFYSFIQSYCNFNQ